MYLTSEMGTIELLSREGEIEIAKRIEAGRNTVLEALCESRSPCARSSAGGTPSVRARSCCAT